MIYSLRWLHFQHDWQTGPTNKMSQLTFIVSVLGSEFGFLYHFSCYHRCHRTWAHAVTLKPFWSPRHPHPNTTVEKHNVMNKWTLQKEWIGCNMIVTFLVELMMIKKKSQNRQEVCKGGKIYLLHSLSRLRPTRFTQFLMPATRKVKIFSKPEVM